VVFGSSASAAGGISLGTGSLFSSSAYIGVYQRFPFSRDPAPDLRLVTGRTRWDGGGGAIADSLIPGRCRHLSVLSLCRLSSGPWECLMGWDGVGWGSVLTQQRALGMSDVMGWGGARC
jgi:hypothetical protein